MIFPDKLELGDKIGVTAVSDGTREEDFLRLDNAIRKLKDGQVLFSGILKSNLGMGTGVWVFGGSKLANKYDTNQVSQILYDGGFRKQIPICSANRDFFLSY